MKRSHELIILRVEIPDFAFEELNQSQGGEFHKKVLNPPFFVLLISLTLFIDYLRVDIAA